jgi:hypothetical protein
MNGRFAPKAEIDGHHALVRFAPDKDISLRFRTVLQYGKTAAF